MKRIKKLTPSLINQIIKEEREKIQKENAEQSKLNKRKLYEALTLLKKIKQKKQKTLSEQKVLDKMTSLLVKKIKKGK